MSRSADPFRSIQAEKWPAIGRATYGISEKEEQTRPEERSRGPGSGGRSSPPPEVAIIQSPPGYEKMSEVIAEFVHPYLEEAGSEQELRNLFGIAIAVWNLGLLPAPDRPAAVDQIVEVAQPEARSDLRGLVENMLRRRMTQYAGNTRAIIQYTLSLNQRKVSLNVLSSLGD
jgi:hypothetical protein